MAAIAAVAVLATVFTPALASAHGKGRGGDDDLRERRGKIAATNDLGVQIFEGAKDGKDLSLGGLGIFYKGTVTAVSGNGFMVKSESAGSVTVDTASAKLIRVPRTPMVLADVKVYDRVWVTGTKTGTNIAASVVYVMSENVRPAAAKGTVTAVSNNTVTVQTKNDKTITVQTTADTAVQKADGSAGTTADVQVGATVKLRGLWDKVTNVFSALKIKIK